MQSTIFDQIVTAVGRWLDVHAAFLFWSLAVGFVAGRIISWLAGRAVSFYASQDSYDPEQEKRIQTVISLVAVAARAVVWSVVGLSILAHFQLNLTALMTSAGLVGLVIGFGAQDLVKNILAGLFIILENQYRVGDFIEIGGVSGRVVKVALRTTILRDAQGNLHHVPNGSIGVASNKTIGFSKVNIDVVLDYDTDVDQVEQIIDRVGQDLTGDPDYGHKIIEAPHFVNLTAFEENGIKIKILGKTAPGKHWSVSGRFRRLLKQEFDKKGISFAHPRVVVQQDSDAKHTAVARSRTVARSRSRKKAS